MKLLCFSNTQIKHLYSQLQCISFKSRHMATSHMCIRKCCSSRQYVDSKDPTRKKSNKFPIQISVNQEYDTVTARHYKVNSLFMAGSIYLSSLQVNKRKSLSEHYLWICVSLALEFHYLDVSFGIFTYISSIEVHSHFKILSLFWIWFLNHLKLWFLGHATVFNGSQAFVRKLLRKM